MLNLNANILGKSRNSNPCAIIDKASQHIELWQAYLLVDMKNRGYLQPLQSWAFYFTTSNYITVPTGTTVISFIAQTGVTVIISGTQLKTDVAGWVTYVELSNGEKIMLTLGTANIVYSITTGTAYTINGTINSSSWIKQNDSHKNLFEGCAKDVFVYKRNYNNGSIYESVPAFVTGGGVAATQTKVLNDGTFDSFGYLKISVTTEGTLDYRPTMYHTTQILNGHNYRLRIKYKVLSGTCILTSFNIATTTPMPYTFSEYGISEFLINPTASDTDLQYRFDGRHLFNLAIDYIELVDLGARLPLFEDKTKDVYGYSTSFPNVSKGTGKDFVILAGQSNADGRGHPTENRTNILTSKSYFFWDGSAFSSANFLLATNHYPEYGVNTGLAGLEMPLGLLHGNRVNDLDLFKFAKGATSMALDWGVGLPLNLQFKAAYQAARAVSSGELKYMVWYQGEQDAVNEANANNYQTALTAFVNDVLSFTASDLKIYLVRIHADSDPLDMPYLDVVRAAQEAVALAFPNNIKLISVDDLTLMADNVHLTFESVEKLGIRIFNDYNVGTEYPMQSLEGFDVMNNNNNLLAIDGHNGAETLLKQGDDTVKLIDTHNEWFDTSGVAIEHSFSTLPVNGIRVRGVYDGLTNRSKFVTFDHDLTTDEKNQIQNCI